MTADSELEITSEDIGQIFQGAEDFQGPWSDVEQDSFPNSTPRPAHITQRYTTPPRVPVDQSEIISIDQTQQNRQHLHNNQTQHSPLLTGQGRIRD